MAQRNLQKENSGNVVAIVVVVANISGYKVEDRIHRIVSYRIAGKPTNKHALTCYVCSERVDTKTCSSISGN